MAHINFQTMQMIKNNDNLLDFQMDSTALPFHLCKGCMLS
jgi:hypothetical protein